MALVNLIKKIFKTRKKLTTEMLYDEGIIKIKCLLMGYFCFGIPSFIFFSKFVDFFIYLSDYIKIATKYDSSSMVLILIFAFWVAGLSIILEINYLFLRLLFRSLICCMGVIMSWSTLFIIVKIFI